MDRNDIIVNIFTNYVTRIMHNYCNIRRVRRRTEIGRNVDLRALCVILFKGSRGNLKVRAGTPVHGGLLYTNILIFFFLYFNARKQRVKRSSTVLNVFVTLTKNNNNDEFL